MVLNVSSIDRAPNDPFFGLLDILRTPTKILLMLPKINVFDKERCHG
jgi:hypothetical protein